MRSLQEVGIKVRHGMREHLSTGPIHKTKACRYHLVECLQCRLYGVQSGARQDVHLPLKRNRRAHVTSFSQPLFGLAFNAQTFELPR
jgi:hypothetical protein